LSATVTKLTIN